MKTNSFLAHRLRGIWLSIVVIMLITACGSQRPNIIGKWAYKDVSAREAVEFFQNGTLAMNLEKMERYPGTWIALDDGRIKADVIIIGPQTFFLVLIGEELEMDMFGRKVRLVRLK